MANPALPAASTDDPNALAEPAAKGMAKPHEELAKSCATLAIDGQHLRAELTEAQGWMRCNRTRLMGPISAGLIAAVMLVANPCDRELRETLTRWEGAAGGEGASRGAEGVAVRIETSDDIRASVEVEQDAREAGGGRATLGAAHGQPELIHPAVKRRAAGADPGAPGCGFGCHVGPSPVVRPSVGPCSRSRGPSRRLPSPPPWGTGREVCGGYVVSSAPVDRVRGMNTIPQPTEFRAAPIRALQALAQTANLARQGPKPSERAATGPWLIRGALIFNPHRRRSCPLSAWRRAP